MNELTALLAAVLFGALIAVSTVGNGVVPVVEGLFNPNVSADFSAKFIKP